MKSMVLVLDQRLRPINSPETGGKFQTRVLLRPIAVNFERFPSSLTPLLSPSSPSLVLYTDEANKPRLLDPYNDKGSLSESRLHSQNS